MGAVTSYILSVFSLSPHVDPCQDTVNDLKYQISLSNINTITIAEEVIQYKAENYKYHKEDINIQPAIPGLQIQCSPY